MSEPSPSGILLIDKPEGPTSMDACRYVRGRLRAGGAGRGLKVGHGGTLDPLATGLVVILVGKATRMCNAVMAGDKRYVAGIHLGKRSPTHDRESPATELSLARAYSRDEIDAALARFVGEIAQRPPEHSAIMLGGRRAYDYARQGEAIEMPERRVVVHAIRVLAYEFPILRLEIDCGKGVYIRSMARDVGLALGAGAMLWTLRRTRVGVWDVANSRHLDTLPSTLGAADLIPVEPSA